jgi:4-diphosphocytidyl-2-C-methyl-D-erythritol kinase
MPVHLAPAKINLFLHVVGRRSDGYHLLETAFQFVDGLADVLTLTTDASGSITRDDDAPDYGADDLIVRAAHLLQHHAGVQEGVRIQLQKHIPSGAGLGGGSSDAATTLVALNTLWNVGYSTEDLAELGVQLGADVPIFIYGKAAWAQGVGEQFTPIIFPERHTLLLFPRVAIPTVKIFRAKELTRDTVSRTITDLIDSTFGNDCLEVVLSQYPDVQDAYNWLQQFGAPMLTGTGSCLFAFFESQHAVERVAAKVPSQWQAFVTKTSNVSGLYR